MKIKLLILLLAFTCIASAQIPIKTLRLKNGTADVTIDSAKVEAGKFYLWIHGLTDPVHAVGVDSTFADSAAIADTSRAAGVATEAALADSAVIADTARAAGSATQATLADSATIADSSRAAVNADLAAEATHATSADAATSATSATSAAYADSSGRIHVSGIEFSIGTDTFDTTAETDTVLVEGGTTESIYLAWTTGDTITSNDVLSMETIDGGFVVHRPGSGTSNLPYAYIKLK
jgi:hypothetical protein